MSDNKPKLTDGVTVCAWFDRDAYDKFKAYADGRPLAGLVRLAVKRLMEATK